MYEKPPSLGIAILLALLGVLLVFTAWSNINSWSPPVTLGLILAGGILFMYAGMMTLTWVTQNLGARWLYLAERMAQVRAITPESRLLEIYASMTPEQLAAWEYSRPSWVRTPGLSGAELAIELRYNGQTARIPEAFVSSFFDNSNEQYCQPVRMYSEGSYEREWAKAITEYLVWYRLAEEGAGNKPARFGGGGKTAALQRFRLVEPV